MTRYRETTRYQWAGFFVISGALIFGCSDTVPSRTGGTGGVGGMEGPKREACVLLEDGPGPAGDLMLDVEVVAESLEVPWGLTFLPNGDILVTERPGRLRLIRAGEVLPAPVLEIEVADIDALFGFEGGLLGVLLHPQFDSNRLFYLYFTATKEDESVVNRIVQYELAEDGENATLDRIILDDIPAGGHHQGGRMRIGPDGLLYAGVGAFEPALAQDPDSQAGKLLRMNLDGSIPADNPNPGHRIFISGIRNSQGYDWFDDDHLLVMDHGPTGLELDMPNLRGLDEFNVAQAGDNLGWASVWGCDEGEGLVEPVVAWAQSVPPGGATVYTGAAIPEWTGSFMVAALGLPNVSDGQHLHRIELDANNPYIVERHEVYLQGVFGRLRTVAMGNDGHLYLTTSNCDGRGTCPPEGDLVLRVIGTL